MKSDRKTKNELIEELESVRRKVKKMETLREKYKHTQQDINEHKRLQEESEASEEYYRGAFETSHDGLLLVHRSQGDILHSNAYAQELLGYSNEEFSKNKLWGIGVVKDDKDFQEALSRLEKDGVVYYNNISVKKKAGLIVDTEVILVDKVKFIQCNIRNNTARKPAEERLRQSEERFRLIAENAADLIAVLDLEGKRIYSSPSYKSILGDPESLRGTDSFQEIHPEDREKIRRIFLETVRTGIGQRAEYRFLLEDGSVRYIESLGSVIRDENGITNKVVVVSRDVTEHKRAEEALRESEDRYRNLVELSPDPIFVHLEGKIVFVNSAALRIFGAKVPDEIIGKSALDFVHPDYREFALKRIQKIYSKGLPSMNAEEKFVRFDGTTIDVEVSSIPCTFSGRKAVQGVVRDITERKRAEEELKKSEGKFRTIFDNTSDGMFLVDLKARKFFICNVMCIKMLGYTQEEFLTLDIDDIHPSEDLAFINDQIEKFSKGEEGLRSDIRFKRKDGSIFSADLRPAILTIAEKKYLLINFNDITERKRAEAVLQESEERYIALFERSLDLVYVCDFEGNFIDANDAALNLLGYKKEEIGSLNFASLLSEDQLPLAFKTTQEIRETGIQKDLVVFRLRCRNGQEVYVESKGSAIISNGITVAIQSIARNITERKLADENIKIFLQAIEGGFDCFMFTDLLGNITYANKATTLIFGYSLEELKKLNVTQLSVNPIDASKVNEKIKKEGGWEGEITNVRKNKELFIARLSTSFIKDTKGNPTGMMGVIRDITERKQAEEDLRQSEAKYRSMFENVQDVYYETLMDGIILEVSPSVKLISKGQYNRMDLIGKSMYEFYPNTNDRDTLIAAMKKTGSVTDFEVRLKNRDGSFISCSISAKINFNTEGRPVKIIGSMHDISERKRAEEALQESETRYRSVLQSATDAIISADSDGIVIGWNKGAERVFGYGYTEIVGRPLTSIMPAHHRIGHTNGMKRCQSEGDPHVIGKTVELEGLRKDGSVFPLDLSLSTWETKEGQYFTSIIRDITERKLAEEALRETTDYLENLLSFANAPIMVWDNNNKITKFNLAFERLTKYTIYDVVGKHPEILFPDETREDLSALISRTSEGENLISVEMPVRCKDGSVRTALWNTANIYSADEKTIIATIAHGQDITDRNRVVAELKESELRFRSLYENATIGIYRTTPDGQILLANPALVEMLGYTSFEKIAERNLEKEGFELSSQRKEFLEKIERDGEVNGYDSKWIRQDGRVIFVLESARAIRDSQGKTLYYDGTVENITERKLLEDQMRQMQKLESLGTLAGGIAHDFNNILGIILAFITSIKRFKDDGKKLDLAVDTIVKAVDRGKTLVKQILTFARKSETEFNPVNINDLVMEIMTMIQETFPKVLTYSQNFDKAVPSVIADRSQLHQALLNLCVNARDAMSSGGVLTINTRMVSSISLRNQHPNVSASSYVCIEVGDTGEGMTEEVRNRIFEPFFTTKEKGKGTGLGLAVVFGVVKTHKGFIEVESELGKGTTFRLYLPVPSVIKPAQIEIQEIVKEIPGGTETVLVVEDEETLMTFLQISLAAKGYTVLSAADGPEAVKTYRERNREISMVFTDLGLPGMTGMEEINLIKKINPDVKIIVATGFLDPEMKSELLKAGVKKFILKPYTFEEILKLIREVLDEK